MVTSSGYHITARRCKSLLTGLEGSTQRIKVRRHKQFGRNRIFVASIGRADKYFIKQTLSPQLQRSECYAYTNLQRTGLLIAPKLLLPQIGTIVLPYKDASQSLHEAAKENIAKVVDALADVAAHLFELQVADTPPDIRPIPRVINLPTPSLSSVIHANAAMVSLLEIIQTEKLLSETEVQSLSEIPESISHGDIKLDNLIFSGKSTYLLDWELLGASWRGWDIAALMGSIVLAWTLSNEKHETGRQAGRSLDDILAVSWGVYLRFASFSSARGKLYPSPGQIKTMTKIYILERLYSGLSYKARMDEMDEALIHFVKLLKTSA